MATGRSDIRVSSVRENSHGPVGRARFERALDAAHSLCDLLWEELHDGAPAQRSAELCERIADVASTVAMLARARDGEAIARTHVSTSDEALHSAPAPPSAERARPRAVLIDEHDDQTPAEPWWASRRRRASDEVVGDGHAGQPSWLEPIESALDEFERDDVPFAVLLVEVAARARAENRLEETIALAVGSIAPATVAPEDAHRYWVLVPRADRVGARAVADRLARAFAPREDDADQTDAADRYFATLATRGSRFQRAQDATSLRVVIGTAACPEDGRDVAALVARAHIELAQARAASAPLPAVAT